MPRQSCLLKVLTIREQSNERGIDHSPCQEMELQSGSMTQSGGATSVITDVSIHLPSASPSLDAKGSLEPLLFPCVSCSLKKELNIYYKGFGKIPKRRRKKIHPQQPHPHRQPGPSCWCCSKSGQLSALRCVLVDCLWSFSSTP